VTADTVPALLALRTAACPQREAIVDDSARITYAELGRRSKERAAWLVAKGVNKGHRVALSMPNGIEWAINAYAVMRIGAVLVPLSTLLRTPELCTQLAVAGVRHMIAATSFRGRDYDEEITAIDRSTLPSLRNIWWSEYLGRNRPWQTLSRSAFRPPTTWSSSLPPAVAARPRA
jgi:acyl-CoA synthetase (AMP-forming)/AMP-acid ligase II